MLKMIRFLALEPSDVELIMLITDEMPTIVGILTFSNMVDFMLS